MFKVWVLGVGESTYATNALEFDTIEEANTWGEGLLMRWFGAQSFAVLPLVLPPTQDIGQHIAVVDCQPINADFVAAYQVHP